MASSYMKSLKAMARKLLPPKTYSRVHNKARAQAGGLKRASNIKKNKSMRVQSLMFEKALFTKEAAAEWAKKNNYSTDVDDSGESHAIKQSDPTNFKGLRKIQLSKGVHAMVGKVMKDIDQPPSIQNPQATTSGHYEDDSIQKDPTGSDVHVPSTEWDKEVAKSALNVKKDVPTFGLHGHELDRAAMVAKLGGEHKHCFILPDGTEVYTDVDSQHEHLLDSPEADYIYYKDGEHQHSITIDGVQLLTELDGKHSHTTLLDQTTEDGTHNHGLVIPGLGIIFSVMPGEYYELKGGLDVSENEEVQERQDVRNNGEGAEKGSFTSGSEGTVGTTSSETGAGNTTESKSEATQQTLLKVHLGSGKEREPGYLGVDTYPHDDETMVHDISMGLPFDDASVHEIKLSNLHQMDHVDPKPLLSEIQRVLMPGGYLTYQGPNELQNIPEHMVMINHEVQKAKKGVSGGFVTKDGYEPAPWYTQEFTRLAVPDAATADDAEPRIGVPAYDELSSDALLAMDALGYYNADDATSGKGNRAAGYPSQGAFKDLDEECEDWELDENGDCEELIEMIANPKVQDNTGAHADNTGAGGVEMADKKVAKQVPICKIDKHKQLVYGVVLEPDSVDAQEDWMTADDIEKAAHHYLKESRVVGSGHSRPINQAHPVESYIAPTDFTSEGQFGNQVVKKGSWILGVKIEDPKEWQKVLNGDYQAFSVGGFGQRR